MTVTSSDRRAIAGPLTAGATTIDVDFPVRAASADLRVERDRAGATAVLDYGTDWTWQASVFPTVGGRVVLVAPALQGDVIRVDGAYAAQRQADLTAGDVFSSAAHNREFDRLWMSMQEASRDGGEALGMAKDLVQTALRVPAGEKVSLLPNAAGRAGKVLAFDPAGNPLAVPPREAGVGVMASEILDSTAPGRALLLATTVAAQLTALGATSAGLNLWGAPDVAAQRELLGMSRSIEKWLPATFNRATDDLAPYVATALAELAAAPVDGRIRALYFPAKAYRLKTTVQITVANCTIIFDDTRFNAEDGAGMNHTVYSVGATPLNGPIAFVIKADGYRQFGVPTVGGLGVLGTTKLAAFVIYNASGVYMPDPIKVDSVSAARFAMFCNNGYFGDIYATNVWGRQTFDPSVPGGTQGDADIINGCVGCIFGNVVARSVHKAGRYVSLGANAAAANVQTKNCNFGLLDVEGRTGSMESSGLGIRNAKDCVFGTVKTRGCMYGLNIQRYAADNLAGEVAVTGNYIQFVDAVDMPTANGTIWRSFGVPTEPIGINHIGGFSGKNCSGSAVYVADTALVHAGRGYVDGCNMPFHLQSGGCIIEDYSVSNAVQKALINVAEVRGEIKHLRYRTGLTGSAQPLIENLATVLGTAGAFRIGTIECAVNGVGFAPTFYWLDALGGINNVPIGHAIGSGTAALARYVGPFDVLEIKGGVYKTSAFVGTQSGITAGAARTFDVEIPGVKANVWCDAVVQAAEALTFDRRAACFADGTIRLTFVNVAGTTQTWLDRNISVFWRP